MNNQTIIEIGPGRNPIFEIFRNEIFDGIGKTSRYLAIACNLEEIQKFNKFYHQIGYAIQADIRDIPLQSEIADQIWLMNVFGGFRNNYRAGYNRLFRELARVIKRTGVIYVGEIYPPEIKVSGLIDVDYSDDGLKKVVHRGCREIKLFMEKVGGKKPIVEQVNDNLNYIQFFLELTRK